ncbi:MAG TPA: hypothetical protein VGG85_20565 [Terracidiphilus sp.]|jgi:F0F1-type ATP synthase assembly protein I
MSESVIGMATDAIGKAGETIAETARTASKFTTKMADAVEDGIGAAKRVVKHSGDAAEEFFDDTTKRLQRHPIETVVASFAAGILVGITIGWFSARD